MQGRKQSEAVCRAFPGVRLRHCSEWVQSLVGDLRSRMQCDATPNSRRRKQCRLGARSWLPMQGHTPPYFGAGCLSVFAAVSYGSMVKELSRSLFPSFLVTGSSWLHTGFLSLRSRGYSSLRWFLSLQVA